MQAVTEFVKKGQKGFEAIHQACFEGNVALVKQILAESPDHVGKATKKDVLPIHIAAATGNLEIVQALIEAGSPVNVWAKPPVSTPLILACKYKHEAVVRYLLDHDANPNSNTRQALAYDEPLLTPLTWCVINAGGDLSLMKFMLKTADPNFELAAFNDLPVHHALRKNRKDILLLLFAHGASLTMRGNDSQTPLDIAIETKNKDLFQFLLVLIARVDRPTELIWGRIENKDFQRYERIIPGALTDLNFRLTVLVQCAMARQQLIAADRSETEMLIDKRSSEELLKLMLANLQTRLKSSLYHLHRYLGKETQLFGFIGQPRLRELRVKGFDCEVLKIILEDTLTCRELGLADNLNAVPIDKLAMIKLTHYNLQNTSGREKFRTDLLLRLNHKVYDAYYPPDVDIFDRYSN